MLTTESSKYLNPQNDIVFKIFFTKAQNKLLLISFLEAVLEPTSPIENLEILNPIIDKDYHEDKGIILDVAILFKDKTKVDVEMQIEDKPGFRKRVLFYWAKLHQNQIKLGGSYPAVSPTISISILAYNEFKNSPEDMHSIFELRERHRGELYLSDIQLHFLELAKYNTWKNKHQKNHPLLDQWIQFFTVKKLSQANYENLLKEPIMNKALKSLEEISSDPVTQELAEMREKARINLNIITTEAFAEGKLEGETKGKIEGKLEGKLEGKIEGRAESIRLLAASGISDQEIARIFTLSLTEVQNILK